MIKGPERKLILTYVPIYMKGFYEYHIKKYFGTLAPRELMFPVTYRCNARCVMCNIWKLPKNKELSLQQTEQLLSDKLFRSIQVINITGGEPTLRKDLVQIVNLLIDKLPELKIITLTTNALDTDRVVRSCVEIAEASNKQGIDFLVEASLDGIGRTHDAVRNVPDAFRKVSETIFQIKQLSQRHDFRLGVNTVISPINLHGVSDVYRWCRRHDINVLFTVASVSENYFSNLDKQFLKMNDEDKEYLIDFLDRLAEEKSPLNFLAYYYHDLVRMIRDRQQRTTPCVFAMDAFILDAYGDMYYCMKGKKIGNCLRRSCSDIYFDPKNLAHRREIIEDECPKCFINCFSSIAFGKELANYVRFLLGGL